MSQANQITQAIIEYILVLGGLAWRNNVGAIKAQYTDRRGDTKGRYVRFGEKGSADVLAVLNGVFYSIEVKAGRDRERQSQLEWAARVNAAGGVAFTARSIDDVMARIST